MSREKKSELIIESHLPKTMALLCLEHCVPFWSPHLKDRTGSRTKKASEKARKEIQMYSYRMTSAQGIIRVTQEDGT